jgi:hypothetical protein
MVRNKSLTPPLILESAALKLYLFIEIFRYKFYCEEIE